MRKSAIAWATALAFPFSVNAQTQTQTLDAVIVTGSPVIEGNSTDTFASFRTTVSAQQIEDLNAVDAAAALRRTPGVSISRFNPVGSFGGEEGGAVYIRGMGTSRPGSEIKTYVDGIPFYMGVWSHPLLDLLPINGMDRLDVYKGPQPQVFGNTFGAVNLVPKRASSTDGVRGDASVRGGSFGTFIEQADLSGRSGDFDYSLAQGYATSDGHRDDADGRLANVMGRVGYRFNSQWSASVLLLAVDNTARDPGHADTGVGQGDRYDTEGHLAALTVEHDHGWAKGSIKFYENSGKAVQKPGLTSRFDMYGVRWREDFKPWSGGLVSTGLDVDSMSGKVSPVGFKSRQFTITSPFVAVSHAAAVGNGWTLTPSVGIRSYSHNQLANEVAPHAGVILAHEDSLALRANYSRGVNYPGVDAAVLSHLISALGTSWRSLDAEKMNHKEIGLTWYASPATTLDVAFFDDDVKDRYVFAFPPSVPAPAFLNLGSYGVQGSEVMVQHKISSGWSVFGGWTWLNSSKSDLPYAPRSNISVGTNWRGGPFRVSFDAQNQSRMTVLGQARADGSANTSKVGGFTVANVRVGYAVPALGQRGEIFAAVENIFDRQYEFRSGYRMPGISAQVGLKTSF
jgi:iron complex outermembrane receptor protein